MLHLEARKTLEQEQLSKFVFFMKYYKAERIEEFEIQQDA
jgi:hypothetical protein